MKKMDNKGFSLVELIVVVAIMAVLIGVLSPQYLKYVERSRVQKDNQAIGEIVSAIKTAMADETVNNYVASQTAGVGFTASSATFTFTDAAAGGDALEDEIIDIVGDTVELTSNSYANATNEVVITTSVDDSSAQVTVTVNNYIPAPGESPETRTF